MKKYRLRLLFVLLIFIVTSGSSSISAGSYQAWVSPEYDEGTSGWGTSHFSCIQEAIDAVIPGSKVSLGAGTYHRDIVIDKEIVLWGDSFPITEDDAVVLNGSLTVTNRGSLTLSEVDLKLGEGESQLQILVDHGGTLKIARSRLFTNSTHGFEFLAGRPFRTGSREPVRLEIADSTFRGVNGLELWGVQDGVIEDSTIWVNNADDKRRSALTVNHSNYLTLRNNTIKPLIPPSADIDYPLIHGVMMGNSHHNNIEGNSILDTAEAVNFSFSWNNRIADNIWEGPIGIPDLKDLSDRWWAVDTVMPPADVALFVGPWANNNTIENNILLGTNSGLISVVQSSHNVITGNTVKGGGLGISILWASHNIIDNNEFADIFKHDAVHAYAARDNYILNNHISAAAGGIGLFSCDANTVQGNTLQDTGRAVFLHDSHHNSVVNNEVSDSVMPVVATNSSGNTITRNNFLRSSLEGYDDGRNHWEGNYWGDSSHQVEQDPSDAKLPIHLVPAPELGTLPFQEMLYRENIIADSRVWEDETVILREAISIQDGGSLTIRNATVVFEPEEMAESFLWNNPISINVLAEGSLLIEDSQIVGPEWGPMGGFQVKAVEGGTLVVRDSEIRNGGFWTGDGAISTDFGNRGAIIENNRFVRNYAAITIEESFEATVTGNTVINSVQGINFLGSEDVTVSGNHVSETAWWGIYIDGRQHVANNTVSDSWHVGIFPPHWGFVLENNTLTNVRGPGVLYQHPQIETSNRGFTAYSLDSCDVEPGQDIRVFVRLHHTLPHYGAEYGLPETFHDVLSPEFSVRLRVNGDIISEEKAKVDLGEHVLVELTGKAEEAGSYDVEVMPYGYEDEEAVSSGYDGDESSPYQDNDEEPAEYGMVLLVLVVAGVTVFVMMRKMASKRIAKNTIGKKD